MNSLLFIGFVDHKQAVNSIDRESLLKLMKDILWDPTENATISKSAGNLL